MTSNLNYKTLKTVSGCSFYYVLKFALPKKPSIEDIDLLKNSAQTLKNLADILGLLRRDPDDYFKDQQSQHLATIQMSEEELNKLINDRKIARDNKEWSKSDQIRDMLIEKDIEHSAIDINTANEELNCDHS